MRAVLFSNGEVTHPLSVREHIRPDDVLVAADGGMRHLEALGLSPQLIIGDMDSISSSTLSTLEEADAEILRFPPAKDETDLELALNILKARGFDEVLIIGALGGRIDQTIANIWLLANHSHPGFSIRFDDGCERMDLILDQLTLNGAKGDQLSLIPFCSEVVGVTTKGLEYTLDDETLFPEKTRGLSNVMIGDRATIFIRSGKLLCIHRRRAIC
jgi:thiamine pyrophosphokinase